MAIINQNDIITSKGKEELESSIKGFIALKAELLEIITLAEKKFTIFDAKNANTKQLAELNAELERSTQARNLIIETDKKLIKAETELANGNSDQAKKLAALNEQKKENAKLNREAGREAAGLTSKYEKQSKALEKLRKRAKDVAIEYGIGSKKAIRLANAVNKLDTKIKEVDSSLGLNQRRVGNYRNALGKLRGSLISLGQAAGVTFGLFGLFRAFGGSIKIVRDFEQSMLTLAGVFRTSREELAPLEEEIREIGATSVRSSTETANLAESLATLGKSPEEIKALLQPVTDLSIGLKAASDEAGEFLVQQLNAFGAGGDEAEKYADIIATIRTSTSLDFQKMRDSFAYLSPISKLLNKDLAYTGALIGVLADNGLKAESSGRLLATSQQKLAKEGLTLSQGLELINKAQEEGKEGVDLLAVASDLFGKQAAKIGVILANNTDILEENAESIRNNGGALEDLVSTQLDSLDSKLKLLSSAWTDYILDTNDATGANNGLKASISFITDNISTLVNVIALSVASWVAYKLAVGAGAIATKLASLNTAIMNRNLLATRIATVKAARGISGMTVKMRIFNAVSRANVLGVILTLLGLLIPSMLAFGGSVSEVNSSLDDQGRTSKEVNNELETMAARHEILTSKTSLNKEEQEELNRIIETISKTVPNAVTEVNKYGDALSINTGKVNEFVEANREIAKLQAEVDYEDATAKLYDLSEALDAVNRLGDDFRLRVNIKGVGTVSKVNGVLVAQQKAFDKLEPLTNKQKVAFKKYVLELERGIKAQEGILDSSAKIFGDDNSKDKIEGETEENKKLARSINVINGEISEQRKLLNESSSRSEASVIQERINLLNKEKEAILGKNKAKLGSKAKKDAEKLAKEKEKAIDDELISDIEGLERKEAAKEAHIKYEEELFDQELEDMADAYERQEAATKAHLAYEKELEDKAAEEKKVAKEKEFQDLKRIASELTNSIIDESRERERTLEQEMDFSENRLRDFEQNANNRTLLQEESAKLEKQRIAELSAEKEKEARKQANLQILLASLDLLKANTNNGDKNATLNTIGQLTFFLTAVKSLKGFYDGTDNVAKSMGSPDLVGRDGYVVRVDGSEQIWSKKDQAETGFKTRSEIKDIINNRNLIPTYSLPSSTKAPNFNDSNIIQKLDENTKAIKQSKVSVDFDYDKISDAFVKKMNNSNKLTKTLTKNRGLFFSSSNSKIRN